MEVPPPGPARFGSTEVEEDMRLCGSRVDLDVWLPIENIADKRATVMGTASQRDLTTEASAQAPLEGELELSGEPLSMDCPNGPASAEQSIRLDGSEVERRSQSRGDFLANTVEPDVETIVSATWIDSGNRTALANGYPLTLVRLGSPRNGDYAASNFTVFTFDAQFDPEPEITSDPSSAPGSIPADISTPVICTIPFQDVGGNIETIGGRFSLNGSSSVFSMTWSPTDAGGSDFGAASGSGTVITAVHVFYSEQGNDTITAEFTLEDDFGQRSDPRAPTSRSTTADVVVGRES